MKDLSQHLHHFFRQKLECDPEWQHLTVGVADACVLAS